MYDGDLVCPFESQVDFMEFRREIFALSITEKIAVKEFDDQYVLTLLTLIKWPGTL